MKFVGKLAAKASDTKDNVAQKYGYTKEQLGKAYDSTMKSASNAANAVAHPVVTVKNRYEQGKAEAGQQQMARLMEEALAENRQRDAAQGKTIATLASAAKPAAGGLAVGFLGGWLAKRAENKERREREKLLKKEERLEDQQLKDARQASGTGGSGTVEILFWIAAGTHFVDVLWLKMTESPPIALYAIYAAMVIIYYAYDNDFKLNGNDIKFLAMACVGLYGARTVVLLLGNTQYDWTLYIQGLLILIPLFPLYVASKAPQNSFVYHFRKWYIMGWIFVGILVLLTTPAFIQATSNSKQLLATPMRPLTFLGQGLYKSGVTFVNTVDQQYQMMIAQATGQQYKGNQESQVGIELTDFKPFEQTYYSDSIVYMSAKISAQNLKEKITIRTYCSVPDLNITGTTNPQILTLTGNEQNTIYCKLGVLNADKTNSYQVKMTAVFDFSTDSDIQYYFVDQNMTPEMYTELKIPQNSVATYTGGPVELGLPDLNQPLRISSNPNQKDVGNYPFGISLTNKWAYGKVIKGLSFTLEVPDSITLDSCTRDIASTTTAYGLKEYYFSVNSSRVQETFDSVSCRMKVTDPVRLFNGNLVAQKTLLGRSSYEYSIETNGNVYIEKSATDLYNQQVTT